MKATLTFTLPDEAEEHRLALHGQDYFCALEDVREAFRMKAKYEENQQTTWEEAYKLFWDTVKECKGVEL